MFTTRYIDVPGARLACLEAGAGPLAVLWHGFPDSADTWKPAGEALVARGYRVVLPYLRGYAPSSLADRYDIEAIGGDVLAVLDALGEEQAVLVGHDWGAVAVLAAAARAPRRVTKLVTVAIPHLCGVRPSPRLAWLARHFVGLRLPGAPARFARDDHAGIEKLWRRWSPPGTVPPPEALEAARACLRPPGHTDAALGYYRAMPLAIPRFMRAPLEVEAAFILGDQDEAVSREEAEAARRFYLRGYEVVMLRGGHFVQCDDPRFPETLVRVVDGAR